MDCLLSTLIHYILFFPHTLAQVAKSLNGLQLLHNMPPNEKVSENSERLIVAQLELIISLGLTCKCYCIKFALLPSQILRTSTPLPTHYRPKLGWAECEAAVVNVFTLARMEHPHQCVLQINKSLPMSS